MSDARDRLLQAIKDVDAEIFGERSPDEVLTNYVVVIAHRLISGDPDEDADAVTRITMPGQALWQTLGLLRTQARWIETQMTCEHDAEDGD